MLRFWDELEGLLLKLLESPQIKTFGAVVLGLVHQLFGDTLMPAHSAVLILVALDWLFGVSYAVMAKQVSSRKGFRGVVKLTLYSGIFIVGHQLDKIQLVGPFLNGSLAGAMVLTEAISVLENIDKLAQLTDIKLPWLNSVINLLEQRQEDLQERREGSGNKP